MSQPSNDQRANADDVHDPLEIVGRHVHRHLGADEQVAGLKFIDPAKAAGKVGAYATA